MGLYASLASHVLQLDERVARSSSKRGLARRMLAFAVKIAVHRSRHLTHQQSQTHVALDVLPLRSCS
eukprot:scaffold22078_cov33-Tisochrysis_lutea.AAC.2